MGEIRLVGGISETCEYLYLVGVQEKKESPKTKTLV